MSGAGIAFDLWAFGAAGAVALLLVAIAWATSYKDDPRPIDPPVKPTPHVKIVDPAPYDWTGEES